MAVEFYTQLTSTSKQNITSQYKYCCIYTRNKLYWTDHIKDYVTGHVAGMAGKEYTITYSLKILK
jgi:hypothetical protein